MNVYKYIWDPVKNTNITLTSKQGKQLLKKYITNLVGGGRPLKTQINPLIKRLIKNKKSPRCNNYFIPKKQGKKTKKKYINKYNPDAPCPSSLLKHKNNKIVKDKFGRWYPHDWDFKSPHSMKSIINNDYTCKNKKGCKKKRDKTGACIDCLNQKVAFFDEKTKRDDITKAGIKSCKKMMKKVTKMREYLESVNIQNKAVLNN